MIIKLIIFLMMSLTSSISIAATYSTVASGVPVPWSIDLTGNGDHYYNPPRGDGWERVTADNSYNKAMPYDVSTKSGQLVRVPAPVKIPIDVSRIGKAVGTFAKRVGPLSMGLAMVDLVCDLSQICASTDGSTFEKMAPGGLCNTDGGSGTKYTCGQPTCDARRAAINWATPLTYGAVAFGDSGNIIRIGECRDASNQMMGTVYKFLDGTTVGNPVTDSDWYAAETVLSSSQFIDYLDAAKEPIPSSPPVVTATTASAGTEIVTRRNDQGTVTGTDEITSEIALTPAPTFAQPDRVSITQTTTTITKDSNNVVISSSVSGSTPPPAKTTDPCVDNPNRIGCMEAGEFEEPLKKKTVDFTFEPEAPIFSGTCPAPIVVLGHELSFQPACDAMTMIRNVVIGMAAVMAAYILMGAFTG